METAPQGSANRAAGSAAEAMPANDEMDAPVDSGNLLA
jgi:hypothetical protein